MQTVDDNWNNSPVVIYCLHAVFALVQIKDLLEIFPFLSNNCRKASNMGNGNEILNPCIILTLQSLQFTEQA